MSKEARFKNKFVRLHLMLAVKFFVGLFPTAFKVKMRKQIWLRNLYSKHLQRSGLFYGFPSPEKLQKQYLKNIAWQERRLDEIASLYESKQAASEQCILSQDSAIQNSAPQDKAIQAKAIRSLAFVIVLSGNAERDLKSIVAIQEMHKVNTLYVIGDTASVSTLAEQQSQQASKLNIEAINKISHTEFDSLCVIRSGDILHKHAVAAFSYYLSQTLSTDSLMYCDCDSFKSNAQRHKAEFYPDWNPDLQLSAGYIKTGLFVSGEFLINDLKEFTSAARINGVLSLWLASLYLRNEKLEIVHLPYVLVHQNYEYSLDWHKCLETLNSDRFAISKGLERNLANLHWSHLDSPLVSIIIPTKNAKSLVETCIESILSKTTYANYEILLIDNNSDDEEALEYFATLDKHPNIRVLSYPLPFNFSAINNFAVQQAKGDVLALINNDVEVISDNWLSAMLAHVLRADIGCVGAKLLYPDGRVQHAGVVLGYGGGAGHAHKYFPRFHPGYQSRLIASHNFSAVTAACLLIKKSDYLAVGGFNENDLAIAFNDVDLCLRVLELGRRNLYCAEAILYHHESISRGIEDTHSKVARFEQELGYLQSTWQHYIDHDPAYNPNLTLRHENFSIKDISNL